MLDIRLMVTRHSVFYSPFIALITEGFLEKENLKGEYHVVSPGQSVIKEIASGNADVGQAAVSHSWSELEKGRKPSVAQFAQINTRDGFFIAARKPNKTFDWHQLKKGSFMFVHGGQPEAMLRYAGFKMGVDLNEIKGINLPTTSAMIDSWRVGNGDFFHEQGPYPHQLEQEGSGYVVASVGEVIGPVAFSSLMCRWDWIGGDIASRFTAAFRASRSWVNNTNPEIVAKSVSTLFSDQSPEVLTKAIADYQNLGTWSGDIDIPKNLYEKALNVFMHAKLIKKRYPYEDVVVPSPGS